MCEDILDSLLAPIIKTASKLSPVARDSATALSCGTKFGGVPYAEAGDVWPSCPSCNNELSFIYQLFDESEAHLLVFYYCFECMPWGLGVDEKGEWLVKLYQHPDLAKAKELTRSNADEYPTKPCKVNTSSIKVLPDWEGIEASLHGVTAICSKINDDSPWEAYDEAVERAGCLDDYATLLGGYPRFVQGRSAPKCNQCGNTMDFYAQIDSEETAYIMWGDAGLVYFFRCAQHKNEFQLELQCH